MARAERGDRLEIERDQQASLAAAAERARIAREMHDVISHNLQVMVTLADAAAVAHHANAHDGRAAEAKAEVAETGRQALNDMCSTCWASCATTSPWTLDARPALEPQPSLAELQTLVDRAPGETGLPVRLERNGTQFELTAAAEMTVYRIVQEALTNTLKHANAPDLVEVRLDYDEPKLTVHITDNGRDPMATNERAAAHQSKEGQQRTRGDGDA